MILAIDTSVGISIAVHDGSQTISEISTAEYGLQGEHTAQYIVQALAQAQCKSEDITQVVVGVGPGPFTGLRVGIVTGLTFAHALSIPVAGICSLDAIGTTQQQDCLVVTDARRKELYWARYQDGRRIAGPAVAKPSDIKQQFPDLPVVGPGAVMYPEFLSGELCDLKASNLAKLFVSGTAELQPVQPMYLRKPDAVEPTGSKQVL